MIIDNLTHLRDYADIHPAWKAVCRFLDINDIAAMPDGSYQLDDNSGRVSLQTVRVKQAGEAKLETHRKMIDIQIPISGDETMGYSPADGLQAADYNEDKDISFHTERPADYLSVKKGMFAVFFPQDAHAPGITDKPIRKAVFKIPAIHS